MSFFHRLLGTFRTGRLDRELDEEMRFHIDMRAEAYERKGVPREEARLRALRRFGSRLHTRERVRDVRLLTWLDSVRQDVALGFRLLRRSPALALAALVSLGLALGSAVGVFAVGDGLLLRPLPVQRPHELLVPQWRSTEWPTDVGIWGSGDADFNSWSFSYPTYRDFAAMGSADVAGFQQLNGATTSIRGDAGTLDASLVTGSFFRVLGLAPAAGRAWRHGASSGCSPGGGATPTFRRTGSPRCRSSDPSRCSPARPSGGCSSWCGRGREAIARRCTPR
ncbi:MAG: macB 2 [Acidobacteria bacterium]|nr:macB 2 [Acidobacteriota bacterium]